MQRRPGRLRTIFAVAVIAAALGACGSDGPAANLSSGTLDGGVDGELAAPAPTEPPAEPDAPAEPEAPAEPAEPAEPEVPEPTAPTTPDSDPDSETTDDGNSWLLPVLVIAGLLLIAVAVGGALSRSKPSKRSAPSTSPQTHPTAPSPQASLLSTAQWITDQLTLELMAAPPAAALQRWSVERSRLDNVAIGAQQQYLEAQDPNWQPLAQSMSALAAAIDTCLALRAQDPPNAQLISDSIDVVNGHRARLQQSVAALLPTIAT